MINKIYRFISENKMLKNGDCVVCGLSGGADSVCLLLVLSELRKKFNISVEALHVNHSLRGSESDSDEEFCRKLCKKLDIPFKAERCNVKKYAAENGLSDEEAARILRYEIFEKNSIDKKIATAHNANDNLETVILNLTRGSAIKGLAGIPPVRGNIIRPILTVTRNEIEAFLSSQNQNYVTDSTNLSDNYTRNKIRHKIIPILQEINSSVVKTSIGAIGAVRSENEFIDHEVRKAMQNCKHGNSFSGLDKYDQVIRRRCLAKLFSDNSLPYSSERLTMADDILLSGGKMNLSRDIFLISDGNSIEIRKISSQNEDANLSVELVLGENKIFPDKIMYCTLDECENLRKIEDVHKKLTFYSLDYDKIIGRAIVRNRRFGDKIQLCGRTFNSSIKKLINETVPKEQRSSLHFIEDEVGTIFAEEIGIADRVKPGCDTVRILNIAIIDWSG